MEAIYCISIRNCSTPGWRIDKSAGSVAFWLIAFVLAVNGFEFVRRTSLRRKTESESLIGAVSRVFQRNKRSYAAMIIHIGIVLMASGHHWY